MKILDDPLVQAMLPIPREAGDRCFYLADPHDDLALYVTTLSRLSCPITQVVKPAWMGRNLPVEKRLNGSNIQPLILTQITTKDQSEINLLAKSSPYLPRTLIMTGKDDVILPPNAKRLTTRIRDMNLEDLMTLPLENLGATILRRFSRKEVLDSPLISRRERRNELNQTTRLPDR